MEPKQKEQLRVLLEARKRSEKVLAERREAQRKKQEYEQLRAANQELIQRYTMELTEVARESGILGLAEEAACRRGGRLTCKLSCYIDYGYNTSNLHRVMINAEQGQNLRRLRPAHLALWITWNEGETAPGAANAREVEIRVHPHRQITFHNSFLPIFPVLWRRFPRLLERMLESALRDARPAGRLQEGRMKRKNISADDCEVWEEKED